MNNSRKTGVLTRYLFSARLKRLGGEFFWVACGHAVVALGGLVAVKALTQKLPPAQYGELALGMTFCTLVQLTAFEGLRAAALRFFAAAREQSEVRAFMNALAGMTGRSTLFTLGAAGLILASLILMGRLSWIGLIAASIVFAFLSSYAGILDCVQIAARQRVVVAWHQGLFQWLRFLIAVALLNAVGIFSTVAMWGYVLASIVILISQLLFYFLRISPREKEQVPSDTCISKWTVQLSSYGWPFICWGVFTWMQLASDRWALQITTKTSEVGLYAVLYQLGYYPMSIVLTMGLQLVVPLIFARAGNGLDHTRQSRAWRINAGVLAGAIVFTAIMTIAAFFCHHKIFTLLVAPEYRPVSALLPAMILSGGLFGCGQVASVFLMSGSRTSLLLAPRIGSAVMGVVLNFAGAHLFGIQGVVWAGVIISTFYMTWIIFLAHRYLSIECGTTIAEITSG
jgi:O-antigen/teichoic acid export membrane protein